MEGIEGDAWCHVVEEGDACCHVAARSQARAIPDTDDGRAARRSVRAGSRLVARLFRSLSALSRLWSLAQTGVIAARTHVVLYHYGRYIHVIYICNVH